MDMLNKGKQPTVAVQPRPPKISSHNLADKITSKRRGNTCSPPEHCELWTNFRVNRVS